MKRIHSGCACPICEDGTLLSQNIECGIGTELLTGQAMVLLLDVPTLRCDRCHAVIRTGEVADQCHRQMRAAAREFDDGRTAAVKVRRFGQALDSPSIHTELPAAATQ